MQEKLKNLKTFNWKLFISLCALAIIPALYQTLHTALISTSTTNAAFDIIGQMEWFDLINETILAFLIIPLYSILNKIYISSKEEFAKATFITGLITFIVYTLFSIGVLIYGSMLIKSMNETAIDIDTTSTYLALETIAFMVGVITSFISVVFIVVGKTKNVYIFLVVKTILLVTSDLIFIPSFGVYGVAISNIVVNLILGIVGIILLFTQQLIKITFLKRSDISIFKEWLKVGLFSGLQQFIDNLIYAIMVCKMVNMVNEQGNYWISNNFIWGILLIPVTALGEVIRRDCGEGYKDKNKSNYYLIGLCIILLWLLSIPLWMPYFKYAEKLDNAYDIFMIVIKLLPFYVAYIGCTIIDSIFIGLGKTWYNMINSLIINVVYYGIFFILYKTNTITFTMDVIILMFGFGMVFHYIISFIEERIALNNLKKNKSHTL